MSSQDQPSDILDDSLNRTFTSLARSLQDIQVPWKKQVIALGTGLVLGDKSEPRTAREKFAFLESSLRDNLVFNETSSLTYKEVETNTSSSYSEHMSVTAGVSIGGSLLGASVEGGFNRALKTSAEGQKTSIHGACRLGIITFKEEPQLRVTAKNRVHRRWLRHPDNGKFTDTYGDYYVAGLVLGANNSVLANVDQTERQSEENWHVKVTVKILFKKISARHDHHESDYQAYGKVSLIGFDSLTGSIVGNDSIASQTVSRSDRNSLERLVNLALTFEERARIEMQSLGLRDGMTVDQAICEKVCNSGLVVDLLLRPMSKLSTYIEATYER